MFRELLVHTHSGLRWVVLILLLLAIVNAFRSQEKGVYSKKDKLLNLFAMVFLHIQLLIGIGLYFVSEKVSFVEGWMKMSAFRFFNMEHTLGMVIAIVLVTMARSKAEKKLKNTRDKHRSIAINYLIALLLILLTIPWPFRAALGGGWG